MGNNNSTEPSAADRDFMAGQSVYSQITQGQVGSVTAELDQARAAARDEGK